MKQPDEEVMSILQRENEAFLLTHMGARINQVQYVEPLAGNSDKINNGGF